MSQVKTIPDGYHSVQPYLIFSDARAAIDFYGRALGTSERMCMKHPSGRVVHAEIVLGDSCIMLADEHPEIGAYSALHYGGSPVSLMVYVEDCDALYQRALAAGATGLREPADQPHGDRAAMLKDPFGYSWYLATHLKDMSKEELEALVDV